MKWRRKHEDPDFCKEPAKWSGRWRYDRADCKVPTERQQEQWEQLLERYAASDDPEQRMVVDIANYFYHWWAGNTAGFKLLYRVHSNLFRRRKYYSSRGGSKAKYRKVHDKAEEVYKDDPDPGKPDAAKFAIELAEAAPKRYGLEAGTKIPYDTIYRELLKRTKYS